MSLRVLCLTSLPTSGAGNRLRVEQYTEPLREFGIELVISSFFDEGTYAVLYRRKHTMAKALGVLRGMARRARDAFQARNSDLVLVYRESAPLGPPLFERMLARRGVPYVFDFDDALFLGPVHPANKMWSWLRHPSRAEESVVRATAVVTVNDYLAEWARRFNARVHVIPTPVDTDRYLPVPRQGRSAELVIGWIGSSTTAPYLHLLDDVFSELACRGLNFLVRVIGGHYSHPVARVELRPWRLATEAEDVGTLDIGLLPEPDDPWTRGKGAFKALLYMASGLPVVASRVGVNPEVIREGETGFCVDDRLAWVSAIERLAADPALRARMGTSGRRHVEERYSLRIQAPRLAAVLMEAAQRSAGRR